MSTARKFLLRIHQQEEVTEDLLKKLKNLNVKEDDKDHLLRCYGRLRNSSLQQEAKIPVLIAPNTKMAQLLIEEAHSRLHCSIAHTMCNVRDRYWISKLRQQVKKLIRTCVNCQRFNNLPYRYPDTAELPERRVVRTRPFEHIGLDYYGPLWIKEEGTPKKCYGCIMTCTSTRLIHLELVKNNTTTSFLNAMRRFIARRGVPKSVTSDNAPTFLLGAEILNESTGLQDQNRSEAREPLEEIMSFASSEEIEWKNITPFAPWQGGFYERLIQSIKRSLQKVLRTMILEEEELRALLTEIEASLNARPLTYQDAGLDSILIIRPIDFIQKDMIISSSCDPQEGNSYLPTQEASKLRTMSQANEALKDSTQKVDKFWAAWQDYYLKELREFHKKNLQEGKTSAKTPSPGEVVLVSCPILPRNSWKLGRILEVVKSEDGQIREVALRVGGGGTIRRPPNLLIPLEIGQDTEQRSGDTLLGEETVEGEGLEREREVPERQIQAYNLRPQRRARYPFDEAEYEVYQLQIIEENERYNAQETLAGTADNLESVAGSVSLDVRTPSTSFRMADEYLKKCVPVSDDEEEEDLLDLGDFDEEEEKEDSPTDEPEGQEKSEEGNDTDKSPVDEPEETEEKEEARPLTRNDLANFGVRMLKLIENIGTRQQVLLEEFMERTEDWLNCLERKLTSCQIRTEYMLSALMYGEEEEEEEAEPMADQPTTSRRAPTEGEPLPKKKREAFEVRVAASQLESLAECPERRVGYAPYALYREGVLVRCRFCRDEGTHATDSCPAYPRTEDRRALVDRRGYCLKCLGHCPREECRQPPESCYYCGGKSHNTALCTLPEERKHYEEVLMRAPARH